MMNLQNLARGLGGAIEVVFFEHGRGAFQKTRFAPAAVDLRAVSKNKKADGKTKEKRDPTDNCAPGRESRAGSAW